MSESVIPWPEQQPVIPLWPTAGQAFGCQRSRTYQLAKSGSFPIPVLHVDGRWLVRTVDLRRELGLPLTPAVPYSTPA